MHPQTGKADIQSKSDKNQTQTQTLAIVLCTKCLVSADIAKRATITARYHDGISKTTPVAQCDDNLTLYVATIIDRTNVTDRFNVKHPEKNMTQSPDTC